MKEYKDSEEIKRQLRIWVQECEDWLEHKEANCFRDCIDLIDSIPAADVVEVVWCKDCKHMTLEMGYVRFCNVWEKPNGMGDDGFCNYGELKENT